MQCVMFGTIDTEGKNTSTSLPAVITAFFGLIIEKKVPVDTVKLLFLLIDCAFSMLKQSYHLIKHLY